MATGTGDLESRAEGGRRPAPPRPVRPYRIRGARRRRDPDTGAGRLTRLRMRPLSTFELGRSSGEVSLSSLMDGARAAAGRSVIRSTILPN